MNRIWIFLWMVLLVCQMVTVWINRQIINEVDLPSPFINSEVIDLANRTNQMWPSEDMNGNKVVTEPSTSRNESLLVRESLILQLQRLESELLVKGTDSEIVEELQEYLSTLDGTESISVLNAYIQGIIEWLRPYAVSHPDCHLERVNLHPDAHADLPVLAFEMSGLAVSMGKHLLGSVSGSGMWRLDEMDLLMPESRSRCWIRGSYVFYDSNQP